MAEDLAAQIVAAANTANTLSEQRKIYRVVQLHHAGGTGIPATAYFEHERTYAPHHMQLHQLLNDGWKIEKEFTTTHVKTVVSKSRRLEENPFNPGGKWVPAHCDRCSHGGDCGCLVVEKRSDVLVTTPHYILSKIE